MKRQRRGKRKTAIRSTKPKQDRQLKMFIAADDEELMRKIASEFGRLGGSQTSAKKTAAARANARKRWERYREEQAKKKSPPK